MLTKSGSSLFGCELRKHQVLYCSHLTVLCGPHAATVGFLPLRSWGQPAVGYPRTGLKCRLLWGWSLAPRVGSPINGAVTNLVFLVKFRKIMLWRDHRYCSTANATSVFRNLAQDLVSRVLIKNYLQVSLKAKIWTWLLSFLHLKIVPVLSMVSYTYSPETPHLKVMRTRGSSM